MNSHETLEIDKIKEQILEYAVTSGGRSEIAGLSMISHRLLLVRELNREKQALQSTIKQSAPTFAGIKDVTASCTLAFKQGVLSIEELVAISQFGHGVNNLQKYYQNRITDMSELSDLFENLVSDKTLSKEIDNCFSLDFEVYDKASPKLSAIRKEMVKLESFISQTIQQFIQKNAEYLTDSFSSIRQDRTVIPVKTSEKHRFKGIIHNQSASGQTTFVEPQILIDLNNQRQSLVLEEHEEILRICKELSAKVAKVATEYIATHETVSLLDSLYARAQWAKDRNGVVANLSDDTLYLKAARHPLLNQDTVVANNYRMLPPVRMLLITGPNTGGKTVSLKTIGTSVYLTLCGIPVLCDEATVPFVDDIYVDIGDKQSIQQSLSTFSSHIQSLKIVVDEATKNSLVLLDELGVGTDPLEGESLAQAILEELHTRQSFAVATTHYNRLKLYAKDKPEILNASVEFNVETLQPTYRFIEGVAGQSYALDIASKLMMAQSVIERANVIKQESRLQEEVLMEELEKQILHQQQLNEELNSVRNDLEAKSAELATEKAQFESKKQDLIIEFENKQQAKLNNILKQARGILDQVREAEASHEVLESIEAIKELTPQTQAIEEPSDRELVVGDTVRVLGSNQIGVITEINKQQVMLDVRGMRMQVKLNKLRYHQVVKEKKNKRKPRSSVSVNAITPMSTEVNVIGLRVEEAMIEVSNYLDSCVLNKLSVGRIIHGHGTGALRTATHQLLTKHPAVKSYRLGGENEGGVGATVVTFK